MTQIIVKRRGHKEDYDERKVYASVYAACLAAREPEETAEKVAQTVAAHITRWIRNRKNVSSNDIFRQVVIELGKRPIPPSAGQGSRAQARGSYKAAFLYENHRDIS